MSNTKKMSRYYICSLNKDSPINYKTISSIKKIIKHILLISAAEKPNHTKQKWRAAVWSQTLKKLKFGHNNVHKELVKYHVIRNSSTSGCNHIVNITNWTDAFCAQFISFKIKLYIITLCTRPSFKIISLAPALPKNICWQMQDFLVGLKSTKLNKQVLQPFEMQPFLNCNAQKIQKQNTKMLVQSQQYR